MGNENVVVASRCECSLLNNVDLKAFYPLSRIRLAKS